MSGFLAKPAKAMGYQQIVQHISAGRTTTLIVRIDSYCI